MGSLWADLELITDWEFPDFEEDETEPTSIELSDEVDTDGWNIVRCDHCNHDYDLLDPKTRSDDGSIICPHCKREQ